MVNEVDVKKQAKYVFFICFIAILILTLFLIKSFIITIVSGVLLTYIFYPLYKWIKRKVRNESFAALATAIIVVVVILIPLIFVANALINESIEVFQNVRDFDITSAEEKIKEQLNLNVEIGEALKDVVNKFSLSIAKSTSDFLIGLPKKIINFFVMLFVMFYAFKEGKDIAKKSTQYIPLRAEYKKYLVKRFNNVLSASLYGLVVVAIIQGAVGALGLWIFDVQSPILWGFVMIVLSMLPVVGASLVWLPAALFKIFTGDLFNGIGLMIYGLVIISLIDNVVRPKIVGSKGNIHPITVLIGVLGGIEVFGLFGIILGPLVLGIATVFFELYAIEKKKYA